MTLKQRSDILVENRVPIIAFVWRPEEITPPVLQMAHQTGSRAIFDFSLMGAEEISSFFQKAAPAGQVVDIKISASALIDPSLVRLLKETVVRNIWVELRPGFFGEDTVTVLKRLSELSDNYNCFPIVGDLDLIATLLKDSPGIGRVVLKGCEASGFVSGETTLVLYSAVREMLRTNSKSLANSHDILIWGGVSTPEAAAAFLCTGAAGLVFESVHWLTDLVAIDDLQRQRISSLRMDSTELVGLDVQAPCRLFNKGNSTAFRDIKTFEDSLCGAYNEEESRHLFVNRVSDKSIHPMESRLSQDEVIPLGVEAAFARSFVERFGAGTGEAVKAFIEEIRNLCRLAEKKKDCFLDSPVSKEMGTIYPFIQGAMSSITDVPEFASKVADAGGLPTIALGLMDGEDLALRLGRLPEIMGERPYAVNLVSLAENPFRETHLAWIKKQKPRFVVIAGGDLSPVKELIKCGIGVIYIAPDEALLGLALESGVWYVVCEGYEAGGHVGRHSTLTFTQIVLDLKWRKPLLFQNCRVIVAGGIFDRETAFMAALLGADAIQMGTAYLATREIVETGALTALYQRMIVESQQGGTVVSGHGTGLRVRSLRTPQVTAVLSLEREFLTGRQDEQSFRMSMEQMAAGSLFAAARGFDRSSGMPLDEQICLERGQFMSGACAGLITKVQSLKSFHRELAEGQLLLQQPFAENKSPQFGLGLTRSTPYKNSHERIAITGMSIINALGKNPEEVWAASLEMKSGIILVPASRWDHTLFYDPRPRVPEKTYCQVGAFLDFYISRNELGIPPQDFRTMTQATKSTLWLADRAIRASGILESDIPRERIAVLISQNSGEAAGTLPNIHIRAYVDDIIADIRKAVHLAPDQLRAIEQELKSGRMAPDDTSLLGRLNCAAAGFICNSYGFMGPSFAVSAACATSLVALHSAIQMVRTGLIDAAIVGGCEENLTHLHFLEFSALGALFGLSGQEKAPQESSCPFDAKRDGMVLGEGGGMIVIERESVARARGAFVHAVITGMGASNNDQGMVESSHASQEMAMSASFRDASYGPDAVDLVECHATSTRQGDLEEVRALKTFFDSSRRTVLTSFKSQIGHTLGASGINNLIRGVTAMKAGVFPPTLNYMHPDPEIGLNGSGLLIAPEPLDWKVRDNQPRRFQVNAFGFGGSNYVVQVEQTMDEADTVLLSSGTEQSFDRERGNGFATLIPAFGGVSFFRTEIEGFNFRMAVVAQSDEEALRIIRRSALFAEAGIASSISAPGVVRSLAQQGIFMGREDLPVLPLAFVFPGQGAQYKGMGQNLYDSFPVIREWMDRAAAAADFDLLHLMFHDQEENLQKTRWQQPATFTIEYAMAQYLKTLGINPVAMAGHSLGELTALCLAGVYSPEDGFRIVNKRALCMDKVAAMQVEPGVMAAVDVPLDLLKEMIQGQENVHIGNINSPNQVVLSGNTEVVRNLGKKIKAMGYRATLLPVSMAFHSPIMRSIHDELEAYIDSIAFHPPQIPVISNTTMSPYPSDPNEIRRILMAHLESTVHWMNNVQALWNNYGVHLFVEVGPGDILSNLIADTLPEAACIQTCLPSAESLTYKSALAQLFVHGHLKVLRDTKFVSLPASGRNVPNRQAAPVEMPVHKEQGPQDHIEALIKIIMDTTGFNREEIQPDMDLRRDLSIRSSRLPIIMDAAERRFGITIELEDFINVRTVRDIARKISDIVARDDGANAVNSGPAIHDEEACPEPVETSVPKEQGPQDHIEALIKIIMDTTGFNRDEIQPDMDLRRDLSIRSSRLPIIMDAAERRFGITIELEDFINVRTVRDIAQNISGIVAGETREECPSLPAVTKAAKSGLVQDETLKPLMDEASLKRLIFRNVPVELSASAPIKLGRDEKVLFLSPDSSKDIAKNVRDIFRQDYGVETIPVLFMKDNDTGEEGYDIFTDEGSQRAAERISGLTSLAGMVIALPEGWSGKLKGMGDVSRLLRGLFSSVKTFLQSAAGKFVVLVHSREDSETPGRLLAEGMLGLFLSAAQEYPSVQFRTLEIGRDEDLRVALRKALDRGCPVVEIINRNDRFFTSEGSLAPSVFGESLSLTLSPGGVVVMSGGATGISAHLARSLVPFRPCLVFLGRTSASCSDHRAAEITRTLADLHSSGIEASYYTCDVTDPEAVRAVLGKVVSHYGRIDGIIHGSGVLRDGLLSHMTTDDFSMVTDVKFLGAWNLFSAAEGAGLRFFVGLSSAAAIQGNPGQANYAAGNRMMSALLRQFHLKNSDVRSKALFLPPVEGAGMADDPEVRDLLKRKGVDYIHVNELAGLFCRELFLAPAEDAWVMFMRRLPSVKTTLINDINNINDTARPLLSVELDGGTLSFRPEDFPMIERISCLDIRREELEAFRIFSQEKDLWIPDHRPFRFLKHPLVSAAMVLETFMEAARVLYPHLQVRGVRDVRLMDMIQCPPEVPRHSRISCRRAGTIPREISCEVSLAIQEISPAGRLTDHFTPHCRGQVILDGGGGYLGEELPGFPVRPAELQTKPMDNKQILKWYKERSYFEDRYRVMEFIEGAGPGVVRGLTIYRETNDFANLRNTRYQYSPYLFEALLQLVGFQIAATAPSERRSIVPVEIGEMRFTRKCLAGEKITIEGRIRSQNDEGLSWDARGTDDQGHTIMQVHNIRMHWISE